MSFTLTSYILICIGHNILLWMRYIKIAWWTSTIKTSPVMGQSYATAAETVCQFGVMIPFEESYRTPYTGRFKPCTISAWWPMMHVSAWLSRSVCCSLTSVKTALTWLSCCLSWMTSVYWLDWINPILWLDLFIVYSLIWFNYFDSTWFRLLSPSPPRGKWWKTLQTRFWRILLIWTRPHVKYTRTVY